jgi:Lrp/AsnC family transcriptional regulator, regulator for asnA, asnC and gidA
MKIVHALQKDARIAFTDIAKELNVSPGKVQARYNKMRKTGVIKGSTLIMNMAKIGKEFTTASIGVEAIESDLEEVNNYIKGLKINEVQIFSWITSGRYNIAAAIFSKNLLEVHRVKQLIQKHPSVLDVSISLATISLDDSLTAEYEGLQLEKIFKK